MRTVRLTILVVIVLVGALLLGESLVVNGSSGTPAPNPRFVGTPTRSALGWNADVETRDL